MIVNIYRHHFKNSADHIIFQLCKFLNFEKYGVSQLFIRA